MKRYLLALLLLICSSLFAATITVTGGGSALATCMNTTANAGDTCQVNDSLSYTGWTQTKSGTSGSRITLSAAGGQTPSLTSGIILSNGVHHLTFDFNGWVLTGTYSLNCIVCNANTSIVDHIIFKNANAAPGGTGAYLYSARSQNSLTGACNHCQFLNSTNTLPTTLAFGILALCGNNNLVDSVTLDGGRNVNIGFGDCASTKNVVRNSTFKNGFPLTTNHIDFILAHNLSYTLVEGNTEKDCQGSSSDCHFFLARTDTCQGLTPPCSMNTLILRYNQQMNLPVGGSGFGFGLTTGVTNIPNYEIYNNTMANNGQVTSSAGCGTFTSSAGTTTIYGDFLNNICWNTTVGNSSRSPMFSQGNTGMSDNYNLVFNTGYSGEWGTPYSGEGTYNTLKNQDPLFVQYDIPSKSYNLNLQNGSPAIGAGTNLTTVAAGGCTGAGNTTIALTNVHPFQDGWGPDENPVSPDWIRVGASTAAQIAQSGITYDADPAKTGTILLASHITCSPGDPVYLYANSSGTVVLPNATVDLGALPTGGTTPFAVTISISGTGSGTVKEPSATGANINCSWNGTTQSGTCSHSYSSGSTLDVGQSASAGSFTGWSGACSGTGTCAPTIAGDITIGATFQITPTCSLATSTNNTNYPAILTMTPTLSNLSVPWSWWIQRRSDGQRIIFCDNTNPVCHSTGDAIQPTLTQSDYYDCYGFSGQTSAPSTQSINVSYPQGSEAH